MFKRDKPKFQTNLKFTVRTYDQLAPASDLGGQNSKGLSSQQLEDRHDTVHLPRKPISQLNSSQRIDTIILQALTCADIFDGDTGVGHDLINQGREDHIDSRIWDFSIA